MDRQRHADWGSTVKLATIISVAAALVGVLLVQAADIPQTLVVIAVMVAGFTASLVNTAHPRTTSQAATDPTPTSPPHLVLVPTDRHAA